MKHWLNGYESFHQLPKLRLNLRPSHREHVANVAIWNGDGGGGESFKNCVAENPI